MILFEFDKKFHGNNLFGDLVASIKDAGKILNALCSFVV